MQHSLLLAPARVLAWLLVALLAAALLSAPGAPFGPGLARAEGVLVLTGDARDLAVGEPGTLRVVATNHGDEAVLLGTVTATVAGGPDGCLTVLPWTGTQTVPPGGAAQVDLPLAVADRAECSGHTWQLDYTAA